MKRQTVVIFALVMMIATAVLLYGATVAMYSPGASNLACWPVSCSPQKLRNSVAQTFVLNLPRRTDKKLHMNRMLETLGLHADGVTWIPGHDAKRDGTHGVCASTDLSAGKLGCSLGHLKAFECMCDRADGPGAWYLFFQDDAELTLPAERTRAMIVEALKRSTAERRQVVYFSCCDFTANPFRGKPIDSHRWDIAVNCPHAIALTRHAAHQFASHLRRNMCRLHCDFAMREVAKRLKGALVLGRPYVPALPFSQFWRRSKDGLIHDKGLFGQRRHDLSSDISYTEAPK